MTQAELHTHLTLTLALTLVLTLTQAELHTYLASMTKPLAVRSSSLFEDAFLRPFAGVYETVLLPNACPS